MICCRGACMCAGGAACSRGRLRRGRCASSLGRVSEGKGGGKKKRTDQIRDEEEDVLLGVVLGGAGRLHRSAIAVRTVPYSGHCEREGCVLRVVSRCCITISLRACRAASTPLSWYCMKCWRTCCCLCAVSSEWCDRSVPDPLRCYW
jgi:hypothetical protein